MNISGEELEKLRDALINAFPDKASLEQMLLFKSDKSLVVDHINSAGCTSNQPGTGSPCLIA